MKLILNQTQKINKNNLKKMNGQLYSLSFSRNCLEKIGFSQQKKPILSSFQKKKFSTSSLSAKTKSPLQKQSFHSVNLFFFFFWKFFQKENSNWKTSAISSRKDHDKVLQLLFDPFNVIYSHFNHFPTKFSLSIKKSFKILKLLNLLIFLLLFSLLLISHLLILYLLIFHLLFSLLSILLSLLKRFETMLICNLQKWFISFPLKNKKTLSIWIIFHIKRWKLDFQEMIPSIVIAISLIKF